MDHAMGAGLQRADRVYYDPYELLDGLFRHPV